MNPYETEPCFRRYEEVIRKLVEQFPEPLVVNPSPLQPITFKNRFRDAIRGFLAHKYSSTIDPVQLEKIFRIIRVGIRGEKIIIATAQKLKLDYATKPIDVGIVVTDKQVTVDEPTKETIESLVTLYKQALISGVIVKTRSFQQLRQIVPSEIELVESENPNEYVFM